MIEQRLPRVPKYRRLYEELFRKIESGFWRPGDRLPAEATLAESEQVSLGTVQKALQVLQQEGLVERRHGSGTYVTTLSPRSEEIYNFYYLRPNEADASPLYTRVLSISPTKRAGPWSRFLGAEQDYIRVQRIVSVDLEFQGYLDLMLCRSSFAGLLGMQPSEMDGSSLYKFIFHTCNAPPTRFTYRFWCAPPPRHVVPHLTASATPVCMNWEILAYTYRDTPLFYERVYMPLSERKLEFHSVPRPSLAPGSQDASPRRNGSHQPDEPARRPVAATE